MLFCFCFCFFFSYRVLVAVFFMVLDTHRGLQMNKEESKFKGQQNGRRRNWFRKKKKNLNSKQYLKWQAIWSWAENKRGEEIEGDVSLVQIWIQFISFHFSNSFLFLFLLNVNHTSLSVLANENKMFISITSAQQTPKVD